MDFHPLGNRRINPEKAPVSHETGAQSVDKARGRESAGSPGAQDSRSRAYLRLSARAAGAGVQRDTV